MSDLEWEEEDEPPTRQVSSNLRERYILTVTRIMQETEGRRNYILTPVLVAENVTSEDVESLPSCVGNVHVKYLHQQDRFYITSLSSGMPHAGGSSSITYQGANWDRKSAGNCFIVYSDGNTNFGDSFSAPDLVISVEEMYRLPGQLQCNVGNSISLYCTI